MRNGRAVAIVNPASGTAAGSSRDELRNKITGAYPCDVQFIEHGGDPAELARVAVAAGASLVIAGGGDGTVSAVASALAGTDCVLGVLPLGTLNHFARDLRIPQELAGALEIIRAGHETRVDVAELNGRVFINNSSLGLYPNLVRLREAGRKRGWSKRTAFVFAALRTFRKFPVLTMSVKPVNSPDIVRRTPLAFIGNNFYEFDGTRAAIDAGSLCVFVACAETRLQLIRDALRAVLGARDIPLDSLVAREVDIELRGRGSLVALDGEIARLETPLKYRIRPLALRVIVPQQP